jgi:hypothetical protein
MAIHPGTARADRRTTVPPKKRAVPAPAVETSRDEAAAGRDYWLRHCEGYRIDGAEGRIGFVDEVRSAPDDAGNVVLAVRAGLLGRRLLLVSGRDVAYIVPRAERIWLRTPATIVGSEPVRAA